MFYTECSRLLATFPSKSTYLFLCKVPQDHRHGQRKTEMDNKVGGASRGLQTMGAPPTLLSAQSVPPPMITGIATDDYLLFVGVWHNAARPQLTIDNPPCAYACMLKIMLMKNIISNCVLSSRLRSLMTRWSLFFLPTIFSFIFYRFIPLILLPSIFDTTLCGHGLWRLVSFRFRLVGSCHWFHLSVCLPLLLLLLPLSLLPLLLPHSSSPPQLVVSPPLSHLLSPFSIFFSASLPFGSLFSFLRNILGLCALCLFSHLLEVWMTPW